MVKLTEYRFDSRGNDWSTPDSLYMPLCSEFHFDLDVASTDENTKCEHHFTEKIDGLSQEWDGTCWMNPPFGIRMKYWVKRAFEEGLKGRTVVCLLPARTNTNWWHDCCMRGEIRFVRGRPKFGDSKVGLPWPIAIVVFGPLAEQGAMKSMKVEA